MEVKIKDTLLVMSGKVRNKHVDILLDNGCNGVIVKRELVDKTNFLEKWVIT